MNSNPATGGLAESQDQADTELSRNVAAVIQQVSSAPQQEPSLSPRKSVTVQDVIGNTSNKAPSEQEAETRVLKSVDGIDPNEGQPEEDKETTRLLQEIAAKDIAARASVRIFSATTEEHEMAPLTNSANDATSNAVVA